MERIDLEVIRKRLNNATPGPWRSAWEMENPTQFDGIEALDGTKVIWIAEYEGPNLCVKENNAAFIVNAPADMKALLDYIDELEESVRVHDDNAIERGFSD